MLGAQKPLVNWLLSCCMTRCVLNAYYSFTHMQKKTSTVDSKCGICFWNMFTVTAREGSLQWAKKHKTKLIRQQKH